MHPTGAFSAKVENERERHLGQGYCDFQPLELRHLMQYRRPMRPFSGIVTSFVGIAVSTFQGGPPISTMPKIARYRLRQRDKLGQKAQPLST
ncbi:hypothetical protein PVK06_024303 [Gossypium arboreum]|uniref:Uncharacterized protein n=1 Tax=Gossypium arboreum TaxID=29729 RepID=A0ABR0PDE3_GOSAR|nr:hypothetical protein PVK06_024303 [Gossypium arboreum]